METQKNPAKRLPNKIEALIPIVVLLGIMISNYVFDWGQDPHIPVLIACAAAMIVGWRCGYNYKEMLAAALDAGCSYIDVASSYSKGFAGEICRRAFRLTDAKKDVAVKVTFLSDVTADSVLRRVES